MKAPLPEDEQSTRGRRPEDAQRESLLPSRSREERINRAAIKWMAGLVLVLAALLLSDPLIAPPEGIALTAGARAFNRLKNRTELPRANDFDGRVNLAELLRHGEDRARWSESHAATVEGYVIEVWPGGIEAA